jgi:hypothetical protein
MRSAIEIRRALCGFKRLHLTGLARRAAEKPLSLETWIAWRAAEPR